MHVSEYQIPHSGLDSAFGAVILFNYVNRYLTKGDYYSVVVREVQRIKILNENGMYFSKMDIHDFDMNNNDLVIYVHNLEGEQIVTRKITVSDLKKLALQYKSQQIIPLPFVKVGSVLEFDATSFSDIPNVVFFDYDIPCIWSGIRLVYYPDDSVRMFYQGMEKPDSYIQNRFHSEILKEDVVERVIIMKNLSGSFEKKLKYNYNLVNEAKAVTFRIQQNNEWIDQIYSVDDASLVGIDPTIYFWENFNPYSAKDSVSIKNHLETILKPAMNVFEKSKAIHQFVSQSYNFNNKYSWLRVRTLAQMDSLKKANSGDLNMLLYRMHKMAGIDAWPVFIGVRNTPRINFHFSIMWNMNHFLVRVIDTLHGPILDATNPILGYGLLPEEVCNYTSIQINPNTVYSFILNPDSIENTSRRYTEIQVSGKTLQYDCRWIPGIYEQAEFLATPARRDSVLASKGPKQDTATNWTLTSYQWTGLKEKIENPECQFRVVFNEVADRISVNPSAGFPEAFPFPETFRKTAIQFPYAMNNKEAIIIQIPSDYEIEQIPVTESFRFEDDDLSFEYSIDTTTPGEIQIRMDHRIRHTFYDAVSYQDIRSYFTEVYKKRSEAIVIRRKKL